MNKKDGTTAWHKDRNIKFPSTNGDLKKAYSTPSILVVDGKPQLISPAAEATIAYDPASGDELWRVIHGGMNEACKPVFGHGLIYLTTGHNPTVLAMKQGMKGTISKEDAVWKTIKAAPSRPSLLLDGDLLYMVSDLGFAACVDAKTGEQKWQERFGAKFDASPVLAAGHIFISDTEGKTHVIATGAAFKSVAINKLDAGCMGSIAVSGNELFIRTKTHLYCIAKK